VREDGSAYPGDQHPAMVALRTGRPVKDVVMGVCLPDRSRAWIQVNATPLFKQGRLSQVYASFEDITRRVQLSHELQHQASTDYLTGVANRRSLMQRVHSEFERSMRHPTVHCCVLAIDLDEFKQINDTWGHATGDAVLIHVARLMREATRQHDVVGRSGGEEFTLLLPDTDIDEAQALAERLRQRIADTPTRHDGHAVPITVSIGIATIRRSDPDADAVLARADRALYQAKHQGRNLVRLAQSA
jgi:diguanylate cyclase (GGDEF)-like protein